MFPVNYFLYLQIIIFLFITPGTPRIVIVSHSVNYGVKKCLWTGVFYLFYLAYDTYKSKVSSINSGKNNSKGVFSFFKDGFLVAGTSPKAWAFFPLIFPQFLDFNSNYHVQFLILMLTYVILDFASLMGYAIVAEKIVKWLKTNPRTINTISACVLIVIAFVIAVTQNF